MAESESQAISLPSFDVDMFPTGDEGSGLHTQNDPSDPYQRAVVTNLKGATNISCKCIDVIHGRFDSDSYGTLLVLKFRFDPAKRSRRVASANIEIIFSGMKPSGPRPEVSAISLEGNFSMVETTQHEEITKCGDAKLGASQFVSAEAGFKWEKTSSADVSDSTAVVGSIDLLEVNYGAENSASWNLMENKTRETGVPSSMQVGILLKRKRNDPFKCVVNIKAEADFMSGLESIFGRKPKDDPVLFDPKLKPTNQLMKYDTENLGDFDLDLVTDVTFVTKMGGVIKEK